MGAIVPRSGTLGVRHEVQQPAAVGTKLAHARPVPAADEPVGARLPIRAADDAGSGARGRA